MEGTEFLYYYSFRVDLLECNSVVLQVMAALAPAAECAG